MERKEVKILLDRLQSAADLALKTAGQAIEGKPTTVPPHIKDHRLTTCKNCDKFVALTSQCRECGCFMNFKTQLTAAECPLKKWGKYTDPTN